MTQGGEAAAELIATIRVEHVKMKQWFMGGSDAANRLREQYGDYPALWKQVLNWNGWKDARKAYMADQQTGGASSAAPVPNSAEEVPRKRKSRWGSVDPEPQQQQQQPPARRSRWSSSNAPPPPPPSRGNYNNQNSNNNNNNGGNHGHYGNSAPSPRHNNNNSNQNHNSPALPGLPGMPSNLAPHQQRELSQLQGRLREINDRLTTVDREATRVDALPRGHRERSPSPPPGAYLLFLCVPGVTL